MLTVSRGLGSPRTREFRVGEPQDAASVGTTGDWQLRGPGVEQIHAYVYFDGEALYVQSALEGREVIVGGRRVGNDWEPMEVSDTLEIGTARITLSQQSALARSGASAAVRASAIGNYADLDQQGGTMPLAQRAPIVIAPGSEAATGEERTAFLPLPASSRSLPGVGGYQGGSHDDVDDEEATRFPGINLQGAPSSYEDEESTRMVSLESRAVPSSAAPSSADDPYDDLQERTHAAAGSASAVSQALSLSARAALDARGMAHPAAGSRPALGNASGANPLPRRQEPPPAERSRPQVAHTPTGPVEAYRPKAPPPEPPPPMSEPTPQPRANWSQEVLPKDASRARATADILGAGTAQRSAVQLPPAEEPPKSIGEMTRVAPLTSDAEAARKQAIALATASRETPSVVTPELGPPRNPFGPSAADDTRRRQQKTARVRGPDGSGAYQPPPPPMALPQEAKVVAPKPPSALKRQFERFAQHFEEVNNLRKVLYLASPFLMLTALYILFGPDPPPPMALPTQVVASASAEPPIAPAPSDTGPKPQLSRPDGVEQKDPNGIPVADAGAPTKGGKPGKNEKKELTVERKAADAYAQGKYDEALALYREMLSAQDAVDPNRAAAIQEVLRILEEKKASGRTDALEQAPPPKSVR